MKELQCAICAEKQQLKELYPATFTYKKITAKTFSARRTPDRMHYRFVVCERCGFIFSNPILSTREIAKLYTESGFDYSFESSYLKKTYGYYLKKLLDKKKSNKLTLLDIGCGNGFFLEEAKALGIKNVWGVEPGNDTVKKAPGWLQKKIKIAMFKKNTFEKDMFDIVCCFHTLDHIVDPNTFLQNVKTILKTGGKILFIVHDTNGLSVKLFGEKSPIFDIEHIYLFNKKTLARLFEKNGFTVTETFSVQNTYPLQYWLRMLPFPKTVKNVIISLLVQTKLANIPFSIRAGNIGIIAQKH